MKKLKEVIFQDKNHEEVGMVVGNLRSLAEKSKELEGILSQESDIEEWVQEKIAVASAAIDAVLDFSKFNPEKD